MHLTLFYQKNKQRKIIPIKEYSFLFRKKVNASIGGFTIIEAVVSVAIFSTVMVVGAGALMSIMGANRKAQTTKSAVDNLNFAIDSMTRALRTGLEYRCDDNQAEKDCGITTPPGSSISFQETPSRPGDRILYFLEPISDGGTTCPAVRGVIKRLKGGITESITSEEVHIASLKFYVYGANKSPDLQQPRVVIAATGFAGNNPKECTTFNIHTSVTQRVFEGD